MTGFGALPVNDDSDNEDIRWAGVARILGPAWVQLPLLTVGLLGVQMMWSVEMEEASPYLISLGLSKSATSIALLAGPLSGLIVQPLIGVIADNSKSRFGRRRPYMMLGTIICAFSLLMLGFTRDIVSMFITRGKKANDTLTIVLAVLGLFGMDFSVNAVMAVDRALIVDSIPSSLQSAGNAWAARMTGIGSVLGFFVGNVELTDTVPFLGKTQLECLTAISVILLISLQSTTAACVKEKVLISSRRVRRGLKEEINEIWENILTLPRGIRQICLIQFLAWLAWFPTMFYTTVYIGDIYKKSQPTPVNDSDAQFQDTEATILGARAMLYQSLVALCANFTLPLFVKGEGRAAKTFGERTIMERLKVFRLCELWAASHLLFAACMFATLFTSSVRGVTVLVTIIGFSWAMTQWAPFSLLADEILNSSEEEAFDDDAGSIRLTDARTPRLSTDPHFDDDLVEIVWEEANERERLIENSRRYSEDSEHSLKRKDSGEDSVVVPVLESRTSSFDGSQPNTLMSSAAARRSRPDLHSHASTRSNGDVHVHFGPEANNAEVSNELDALEGPPRMDLANRPRGRPKGLQAKSGIIIGIHNLFIVIPQFISTGITSVVFALLDPAKSGGAHGLSSGIGLPSNGSELVEPRAGSAISIRQEGPEDEKPGVNAVAVIFRIGGIFAMLAFIMCLALARELRRRAR